MQKIAGAVLGAVLLTGAAAAEPNGPAIAVTGGMIRGQTLEDGSQVFRGIPYAAPPVGSLRFKAPEPVHPWPGVRDAVAPPSPCLQQDEGWNSAEAKRGSEDCLYLSLHVPQHKAGEKLPVFVWIHGGSNRAGSGFGTADSALYRQGIIVVGIEYRLGVFGFLGAEELSAESAHRSSGNYGVLDQIAALSWVQNNIAAFGGDPARVTAGGQSAGAIDTAVLLRSPLAKGLFARAVLQSQAFPPARTLQGQESIGRELMTALKLGSGSEALQRLRALPAQNVLDAAAALKGPDGNRDTLWSGGFADNYLLRDGTNGLYHSGAQAPVPLLLGDVTREFAVPNPGEDIVQAFFKTNSDAALALYGLKGPTPPPDDPLYGNVATAALTDYLFRCTTNQTAAWQEAQNQPAYRYLFGYPRPGQSAPAHNAELDYVFDAPRPDWPPLQAYWANFIKTGNPNGTDAQGKALPLWPRYGQEGRYIRFLPGEITTGQGLRREHCALVKESLATPEKN